MTPIEFLISTTRSSGALTTGLPLIFGVGNPATGLIGLDYIPFLYETPEGRSEFGFDWMGSTNLLNRMLLGVNLAQSMGDPLFDPVQVMVDEGVSLINVEAIADFWLQRAYQNFYTLEARDLVIQYLSTDVNGNPSPLIMGPNYEPRIRSVIGYILTAPQAQKQ